ncbi:MAG: hypothetical protein RLO50_03040 [Azospirillaceae bacterium]
MLELIFGWRRMLLPLVFLASLGQLTLIFVSPARAIDACCWEDQCSAFRCDQCVGTGEGGVCPGSMITANCPDSSGDNCSRTDMTIVPGFTTTPPAGPENRLTITPPAAPSPQLRQ